jgi:hypothetical protein
LLILKPKAINPGVKGQSTLVYNRVRSRGRIDPVTGDVVPTGKRSKPGAAVAAPSHSDTDYKALYEQALVTIAQKDAFIAELRSQLNALENDNRSCRRSMKKACDILTDATSGKERLNG